MKHLNFNTLILKIDNNNYKIIIDPLNFGLANILGNSIRKTFLLFTEGYAFNKIFLFNKINEFGSLNGIKENIHEIIFNLKNINFELKNKEEKLVLYYNKNNSIGNVKLSDLENSDKLLYNEDTIIFNITKNIDTNFEFHISKGCGYLPANKNKKKFYFIQDDKIHNYLMEKVFFFDKKKKLIKKKTNNINKNNNKNYIILDVNFNPIKTICYREELIKFGIYKNKFRLIIDITTNGLINLDETYRKTLDIIENYFINLKNNFIYHDILPNYDDLNLKLELLNFKKNLLNLLPIKKINQLDNLWKDKNTYIFFKKKKILKEIIFNLLHFKYHYKLQYETSNF